MRRLRGGGLPRPHLPGQREVRAGAGRGAGAQDLRQPQEAHVSGQPSAVFDNRYSQYLEKASTSSFSSLYQLSRCLNAREIVDTFSRRLLGNVLVMTELQDICQM